MPNATRNCFADTNVLIYVIDPKFPAKQRRARDFLRTVISLHSLILSPQSLNECYRVATEKRDLMPRNDARRFVEAWLKYCAAPYDFATTRRAWEFQDSYGFGWWDSMLLASAALARCDLFISEDMQHERRIGDMTIVNPFLLDSDAILSR
jgi:predicted nucleic acid-binding protein